MLELERIRSGNVELDLNFIFWILDLLSIFGVDMRMLDAITHKLEDIYSITLLKLSYAFIT